MCKTILKNENVTYVLYLLAGQIFSWGKNSRGRLGRQNDRYDIPGKVMITDEKSIVIESISCSQGNTLLVLRHE